ncbi:hypothetical protein F4824DRAFT_450226 [Ustulina deusta]|nr:hypothetical protein F4824DRAFT_450226 [Ustulina deusta]
MKLFPSRAPEAPRAQRPLDLSVQLSCGHADSGDYSHEIVVGFHNEQQARQYSNLVFRQPFTQTMGLHPYQHGRHVTLRLPSRVTMVHASTTYGGFYIHFNSADLAKQWRKALLLWQFLPNSENDLYIERLVGKDTLDKFLQIPGRTQPEYQPKRREPDLAPPSELHPPPA